MQLLAASLALTSFLPANPTFAEEVAPVEEPTKEVAAPVEETAAPVAEAATPEDTAVEAETNVDYLNYLELEDFLITAERIPTNKWDTPANVTVITAKEIEENHYQNLTEALNHVNGVFDSASRLQMNGGSRTLVLIDGRRWLDPQISEQNYKSFTGFPSMKMIERIEVVKGGNSALYGSDAFNGIINIVTKKGTKNETTIDLNTSIYEHHRGQHQYELTNQGSVGKFGWFVTSRLYKSHPWEYKRGLATDLWEYTVTNEKSQHNFSARLDQRFTERDSLTFDFIHISEDSRYYVPYFKEYYPDSKSKVLINNASLSYNFKEGSSTPGWLRYVNNYYTMNDLGTEDPHVRMQGIDYQNGWELGQHKIIAGMEWRKSTASYVSRGYKDVSIDTKSIYLQDTISMGDRWTLIPGVRYDHSSEFGNNWSPKFATNYRPDEKTKFYATWGRSYNVPLINELYAGVPDDENLHRYYEKFNYPTFMMGDRTLKPEKGYSAIIGIEHDFSEKAGFTVNVFQNRLKHTLAWNNVDVTEKLGYLVQAAVNYYPLKSRGMEATFHQKIDDHFSYNLGYSHTHTHMELPDKNVPFYRPQPNSYRVGLNYHNRGLKANLHAIMASSINTQVTTFWKGDTKVQAYPKRRYAVLDFNLSYDLNDTVNFYFKALNFTNQHYSNEESDFYNSASLKTVYPAKGRSLIYGVNLKF